MAVEVVHEVFLAGMGHLFFQLSEIMTEGAALLFYKLPSNVLGATNFLDHIVVVVNLEKPGDDLAVIGHVCILKLVNMHHNLLYFLHALGGAHPQLPLGLLETLGLDVLDLSD